jgi:hypothetical protein
MENSQAKILPTMFATVYSIFTNNLLIVSAQKVETAENLKKVFEFLSRGALRNFRKKLPYQ